jgi:WD40 repeat protein
MIESSTRTFAHGWVLFADHGRFLVCGHGSALVLISTDFLSPAKTAQYSQSEDKYPLSALCSSREIIVSGDEDGNIRTFNLRTKKTQALVHRKAAVTCLGASADGKYLAFSDTTATLGVLSLENGKLLGTAPTPKSGLSRIGFW